MNSDNSLFTAITEIIEKLFQAEKRRLQNGIDRLVEQHQEITNDARTGFMYNGVYFRHSKTKTIERLPMLAWDLNDAMSAHLKDEAAVMLDCQQIRQTLYKLMSVAQSEQQLRDVLPDCIVSLVPQLDKVPRQDPVELLIEHDPRLMRQYTKMLPKMQFYTVSGILY